MYPRCRLVDRLGPRIDRRDDISADTADTLSGASIRFKEADAPDLATGFKAYPKTLPAILLGRLAVDRNHRGDAGKELVRDALLRSIDISRDHVGALAMLVDPYEDWLVSKLYGPLGFQPLLSAEPYGRQVILLETVARARTKRSQ
jgi:hypothetical protein